MELLLYLFVSFLFMFENSIFLSYLWEFNNNLSLTAVYFKCTAIYYYLVTTAMHNALFFGPPWVDHDLCNFEQNTNLYIIWCLLCSLPLTLYQFSLVLYISHLKVWLIWKIFLEFNIELLLCLPFKIEPFLSLLKSLLNPYQMFTLRWKMCLNKN
jgi:hypothetical protein